MDGIFIIDKKEGMTSFNVVRDIRKEYNIKKVGHAGTLDPMATGVLLILVGKATKLSDILMNHDKEYVAVLKFGIKTDSADREGTIIEEDKNFKLNKYSKEEIKEIFKSFIGKQEQVPPMYSALKVNGKKLYELARKGETIERKAREIEITEIEVVDIDFENNKIKYRVVCSKGTYIRTLCEDIAKKFNTIGIMDDLRRTRVGEYKIQDAGKFIELDQIKNPPQS